MVGKVGYPIVAGGAINPGQGVSCRFVPKIDVYSNSGRISKGVVWIDGIGDNATFAIYSDNAGNPSDLLAYSSSIPLTTGAGWYNFCELTDAIGGGLNISDGNPIHLAVWVDNPGGHSLYGDNNGTSYIGGTNTQFSELLFPPANYPNWDPHIGGLGPQSDLNLSIYVEYYSSEIVLGYPSVGNIDTGTYSAPAQIGSLFTAPAKGTKLFDTVYVRMRAATTAGRMSAALYLDAAGAPGTLISQSGGSYVTYSTTEKWYGCPMKGQIKEGDSYWIVISCNQNFIMKYDIVNSNSTFDDYTAFNVFGSTYNTTPDAYYKALMSFYLQNSTYFAEAPQYTTFNGLGGVGKVLDTSGYPNNLNKPKLVDLGYAGSDFIANSSTPYSIPGITGSAVYTVYSDSISRFAGTINLILPNAAAKDVVGIKNVCSLGNVIVISGSGQTIDGQSTWTLIADYREITLVTNGSNWFII